MKEELSLAVEAYVRFRKSQDYSGNTLRSDVGILKQFLSVNGNIYCHSITEVHVERHFERASRTRSAATLRNDYTVLSQFFKWARHTRRMPVDSDPLFGRRSAKGYQRERNRIHVTEFPRLLDAAEARDPRDRALVAVLLYTLQRDSEARDLRIRDLALGPGTLMTRVHKSRLEDQMPVSAELDAEMRVWLTHYTEKVGPLKPHYFLLPARKVQPIHNEYGRISHHACEYRPERQMGAGSRIINPILESIDFPTTDENGKPSREGCHTIRRSGARALFDQLNSSGYDHALRVVQSLLHHKSMMQTETYIGVTADRRSRDEIIRGKRMYHVPNVVQLHQQAH